MENIEQKISDDLQNSSNRFSKTVQQGCIEYTNEVIGAVLIELSNRGIDITESLSQSLFDDTHKRLRLPW